MKIKCPACAAVLSIPDAAAGKVVKCPCGKQLRAPGGAAAPTAGASRPLASAGAGRPAAVGRGPAATASRRGSGSLSDFDPAMFDELTDKDLKPAPAVGHGRPAAPTSAGGKLQQQYAPSGGGSGLAGSANRVIAGVGSRISGALIDGIFNLLGFGVAFGVILLAGSMEIQGGAAGIAVIVMASIAALLPAIVNIVLISMSGQSLGKKLVGTRMIIEASGQQAGFMQGVLVRQFGFGFLTGLPVVGAIIALADVGFLFSEDAKTLHDRLAGTVVVRA